MTAETKPFDDPSDEREWQAQQRAFDAGTADGDALAARYRDLARGLRALHSEELPADFARRVAEAARRQDSVLDVFERVVLTSLCILFVGVLYVFVAASRAASDSPPTAGSHWLWVLIVCASIAALPTVSGAKNSSKKNVRAL